MTETTGDPWTVGRLASEFDLTVRTLHHYDKIGLLVPSDRSRAGYRLYTRTDLDRLAMIVVYRRLGFSLDEISALLTEEGAVIDHLQRQRESVMCRLNELNELVKALDNALEREMNNRPATPAELKELFGEGFSDGYPAEAHNRWGETQQWQQAQHRTASYTADDWVKIKAEADELGVRLVQLFKAGEPASGEAAMSAAEAHRVHIEAWYYELNHAFHRQLGELYVTDANHGALYESLAPGLAQYVRNAIKANADRHES